MNSPPPHAVDARAELVAFQRTGDPERLARVFDATATQVLALALHLARDPAAADDLVQATYLTVLEKAATFDGSRPVLPWLTGILRRHAKKLAAGRPALDPARTVRPDAPLDPARASQHDELVAVVRAHVDRLGEAYRPVLLLHLEHGLSAIEIGEVLARSPATVRVQLQRGLARLRELLPPSVRALGVGAALTSVTVGDLAAMRTAIVEAAVARSAAGVAGASASGVVHAATWFGGALVVKKIVLGFVSLAVVAALWWGVVDSSITAEPPAAAAAAAAAVTSEPAVTDGGDAAPSSVLSDRSAVATGESSTSAVDADGTHGSVVVRVRWCDEAAAAAVPVVLTPRDLSGFEQLAARRTLATDAAGEARFDGLEPGAWSVGPCGRSGESVTVVAGKTVELETMLDAGVAVVGRVVDVAGVPVAGAEVWMYGGRGGPGRRVAVTDAAGAFRVRDAPREDSLWATAAGHGSSAVHKIEGAVGAEERLEVRLGAPGARVVGRVVDASRRPIGSAVVVVETATTTEFIRTPDGVELFQPFPIVLRTDAAGEFESSAVPPGSVRFAARAAGFAPTLREVSIPAAARSGAAFRVDLTLTVGGTIRGRFLDASGAGVESHWIQAWPRYEYRGNSGLVGELTHLAAKTTAEGSFAIEHVMPGTVRMFANASGGAIRDELVVGDGEVVRWEPRLEAGGTLVVRVVDADGRPRSDVAVDVSAVGEGMLGQHVPTARSIGADGRRRFDGLTGARYVAQVFSPVLPYVVLARSEVVEPNGQELVVRLADERLPTASFTARILRPDGEPFRGLEIELWCEGAMIATKVLTDDDGRVVRDGLAPGPLTVTARAKGMPILRRTFELDAAAAIDAGTIAMSEPGRLVLRVRDADGAPLRSPSLQLVDASELPNELHADDDGLTWRSPPLWPGTYRFDVRSAATVATSFRVDAVAGEVVEREFVVAVGCGWILELALPDANGAASSGGLPGLVRCSVAVLANGLEIENERVFAVAKEGVFRRRRALGPGRYTVRVTPFNAEPVDRELVLTGDAGADQPTVRVELR